MNHWSYECEILCAYRLLTWLQNPYETFHMLTAANMVKLCPANHQPAISVSCSVVCNTLSLLMASHSFPVFTVETLKCLWSVSNPTVKHIVTLFQQSKCLFIEDLQLQERMKEP